MKFLNAKLLGAAARAMLLGMVLGPLMEENLRRALLISRGDWSVFLTRPLSATLMAIRCGGGSGHDDEEDDFGGVPEDF